MKSTKLSMLPCTITYGATSWSQAMEQLLTEKDEGQSFYADSAYTGEDQEMVYKKKKVINKINEKGYRNNPLTEEQKAGNKEKSRTRARVEHLFGFVENSMDGSFIRTIGIARAKAKIGMMNIQYLSLCSVENSSCHGIGMPKCKSRHVIMY